MSMTISSTGFTRDRILAILLFFGRDTQHMGS